MGCPESEVTASAGSEPPVVELVFPLSYTDIPCVVRVAPDRRPQLPTNAGSRLSGRLTLIVVKS